VDSPYDVLGVEPDADEATVVRAYRRRVKETHPDQGGSTAAFKRVQDAYAAIEAGEADQTTVPDAADIDTEGVDTEAADPEPTEPQPDGARVEYLDYEVLAEQGWEIDDEDLFEKAAEADLEPESYGRLLVNSGETILEAAEERGFSWPFACRGGACANCAVALIEGDVEMPSNHVLSDGMVEEGIRLSCMARPATDELKLVFNVHGLPGLEELRLPSQQFR
jgi:ferredoxin